MKKLLYVSLVLALWACTKSAPVPVVRLDQALAAYDRMDDAARTAMADSLAPEINAFFQVLGHPNPTTQTLEWWSTSREVSIFQPDVDKAFPTLSGVEMQIGHIMDERAKLLGDTTALTFVAVVWGKPQPIVRNGDIVMIALNHYLGADYPGYSHWEAYRRTDKEPWAIAYDLAAVLAATQFPFEPTASDPTLLSWMLYEGVLVHARMELVQNPSLAHALGYTPEQLEYCEKNEKAIWQEMAARKLIYDTDPATIDRMLGASPSTPLLGGTAPGRIGRYIGYKIVKSYLKRHPDASLPFLLSPEFYYAPQSLIDSGY